MNSNDVSNIEKDIMSWIVEYIEVKHEFYDYKFPPCPYARSARINNLLTIQPWKTGSFKTFLKSEATSLIEHKKYNVKVLVFPAWCKWNFLLRRFVRKLNPWLINNDMYVQIGSAISTHSKYKEPFFSKNKPYCIVIINKLSDVLDGHQNLLSTDYYHYWSNKHYCDVVERRENDYKKYKN